MRFALEHNVFTPAALHGYYALGPGTRVLLYCVRIGLTGEQGGAEAIATLVSSLAKTEAVVGKILDEHLETEAKDAGAQMVFP
jgi:hypothetical protein